MSARTSAQVVHEAKQAMKEVNRQSEAVAAAGFGLRAIGDLLGADASEHHMTEQLTHGLAQAVVAIGTLLEVVGGRLWEISEEDQQ